MKVNDIGLIIEEKTDRYPEYPERQAKNIAKLTDFIKSTNAEIANLKATVRELKSRIEYLEEHL